MIVVAIVALLAAIALPSFMQARKRAQNAQFINDVRVLGHAGIMFAIETNEFPEDASTGEIPEGMETYIDEVVWNRGPAIGGRWDFERDRNGTQSSVGAVGHGADLDQLLAMERIADDGDLSTGQFIRIAGDRYYYIIE